MKYIYSLLVVLVAQISIAQIGIGTFTPDEELEIKGDVAFRKLELHDAKVYNRYVAANEGGKLGFLNGSIDGYNFVGLYSAFMPNRVVQNSQGSVDLNLKHSLELRPNSSTIVIINYNIPIYIISDASNDKIKTVFAGAKLMRKRGNEAVTELSGGNRKFSFSDIYRANPEKGMFIEGKWIETLENNTANSITVEYSLLGFIDGYKGEAVYFSYDRANINQANGLGGIALKVYIKAL